MPSNPQERRAAGGQTASASSRARAGLVYGLTAYAMWGVFPLYFKVLSHVPPLVVLCHRILWSAFCMGLVVSFRREWRAVVALLFSRRRATFLSLGAILIALNWLIFIYAVASKQTLEASLGYFINPLLSVALGVVFLKERLRPAQWLAVGIAGAAVANMTIRGSGLPWIAVSLACTFGFYGLVRKKADLDSLHALFWESVLLVLPAAGLLGVLPNRSVDSATFGILSMSGVITAVPLLFFGAALRRLRLSTVGFLQYIGPTLQFLVAIAVFREPMDHAKLMSFILSWLGIGVYAADSLVNRQPQVLADEPE